MEGNLLLEQFSRYKKLELEASPFHFLLDANIELNPHQINAFCAAIQALKTGGIVLADEVGLGKTIEAGLVLKYVLESGAKRVLIALPASLRKQWELELEDKFGLESVILDRLTVEKDSSDWRKRLTDNKSVRIVLTSYDYSSKLMKRFPEVKWDFIIIDEAHNLRNVFHGTKRAKNLYELSKGIPKILLTATPLQNSLTDLHGLVSFIDQRIFGSEYFVCTLSSFRQLILTRSKTNIRRLSIHIILWSGTSTVFESLAVPSDFCRTTFLKESIASRINTVWISSGILITMWR